jgi:hypothetical protein
MMKRWPWRACIGADRYPLSPRIGVLNSILARLQPREPAPAAPALRPSTAHRRAAAGTRMTDDRLKTVPGGPDYQTVNPV